MLRYRSPHEGGPTGCSQVGQLECQLSVLDDGVSQHLLVPQSDVDALLDHLRVLRDIRATTQLVTCTDVLQVKQPIVLVALVPEAEVDAGAVLGGGPDEVCHDAGDV